LTAAGLRYNPKGEEQKKLSIFPSHEKKTAKPCNVVNADALEERDKQAVFIEFPVNHIIIYLSIITTLF